MSIRTLLSLSPLLIAGAIVLFAVGDAPVGADESPASVLESLAKETATAVERSDASLVKVVIKRVQYDGVLVGTPARIIVPHIGKVTSTIKITLADGTEGTARLIDGDAEFGISVLEPVEDAVNQRAGLTLARSDRIRRGSLGLLAGTTPQMTLVSQVDTARGRFQASIDNGAMALLSPKGGLMGLRSLMQPGAGCSACHTTPSLNHFQYSGKNFHLWHYERNTSVQPKVEGHVVDVDGTLRVVPLVVQGSKAVMPPLVVTNHHGNFVLNGSNGKPVRYGYGNNPSAHANDYISADVIRRVLEDIDAHGKIRHAYLGVVPGKADAKKRGVRLASVLTDSPAAKAGLAKGAVVTGVDGSATPSPAALTALLAQRRPGDRIRITRHGADPVECVMGDRDEVRRKLLTPEQLGLKTGALDDTLRTWLNLPEDAQGVLVTGVTNSPAQAAGVKRGDLIVSVGGKPVRDVAELEALLADASDVVRLNVQRGSTLTTLHLRPLPARGTGRNAR